MTFLLILTKKLFISSREIDVFTCPGVATASGILRPTGFSRMPILLGEEIFLKNKCGRKEEKMSPEKVQLGKGDCGK